MLSAVLPSSVQPPHVLLTTVFIGVISCVVAISSAIVSSQMLPSLLLLPAPVLLPSATMSSAAIIRGDRMLPSTLWHTQRPKQHCSA
jgi:hypothetical protein